MQSITAQKNNRLDTRCYLQLNLFELHHTQVKRCRTQDTAMHQNFASFHRSQRIYTNCAVTLHIYCLLNKCFIKGAGKKLAPTLKLWASVSISDFSLFFLYACQPNTTYNTCKKTKNDNNYHGCLQQNFIVHSS